MRVLCVHLSQVDLAEQSTALAALAAEHLGSSLVAWYSVGSIGS